MKAIAEITYLDGRQIRIPIRLRKVAGGNMSQMLTDAWMETIDTFHVKRGNRAERRR